MRSQMRSPMLCLAAILSWYAGVAVAQADLVTQVLQATPKCALPCVLNIFSNGLCSIDSIAPCVCSNTTIQADLSVCAQQNCIFEDQLRAVALETSICAGYPQESRSYEVKITAIICCAVVFPFVLLRFFSRIYVTGKLWGDDYVMIVAAAAQAAIAGIEIASADMGFGMHYWQLEPSNGEKLLRLFWVVQMLYIFIQVVAKVAIVLLLSRIFQTPRFRLVSKIISGLLILHGVIFFFIDAFQCVPVSAIWDRTLTAKRCVDITALGYTGAGFSIVEDLILLFLPIPWVLQLHMNLKRQIGILVLFSLGSFATVTSMVRLKYLIKFSRSFDLTWDNVDVVKWSLIEGFAAIACGSLPAVWPLVSQLAPHLFGSSDRLTDEKETHQTSTSQPSSRAKKRPRSKMTGMTSMPGFGASDEELQPIPKQIDDIEEYYTVPPPPSDDGHGLEFDRAHYHKARIVRP